MTYLVNEGSALPLNKQAENYLRHLILEEAYQNGAMLPTEVELAKNLGIARNTVRTAMDKLVQEGLVTRKKGVGTQVNRTRIATELTRWQSFTLELGDRMKTLQRGVQWVEADRETARELSLLPGETVCCLERLKGTEAEPMVLLVSYFPREMNIDRDETFEGRLYTVLAEKYGASPAISREEIGAMAQTAYFAKRLHLPHDVPVLYRKRRVLDPSGRLIELAYAFYRADRFTYQIDIHSEEQE